MRKNQDGFIGVVLAIIIVFVIFVLPVLLYRGAKYHSIHYETFKVTKLPNRDLAITASGNKNQYANLVYTDKGVFANKDSWFPYKTRSSDVYNQLEVGKTYHCEVAGWRLGFFSTYKNIITCDGFTFN